jgi:glutamate-1-semialdehyde 2,1-aminomutase
LAAGLATLQVFTADMVESLNRRGDALRSRLMVEIAERDLPLAVSGFGSILQVHGGTTPPQDYRDAAARDKRAASALFFLLLEAGVFAIPGRCHMNISAAIGEAEMGQVEAALDAGLDRLAATLV